MKILHLDFDDLKNPMGGGQAVRTFEINRRLAKRHQITVVTSTYAGAKDEKIEGIQYIRIGKKSFPWNFLAFLAKTPQIVKKYRHDLVIENFIPPIGPALTPLFTKKPVIAMVDWAFAWEMSKKYKLPFFLWQDIGIKLYKNFIFPTQAIRKYLLKGSEKNKNIFVAPNLALTDFYEKPKQEKLSDYILFIGRLDIHQKGIDLLLRAYRQVLETKKIPLIIAGDGRDKKKIQKEIKKLGLERNVTLIGSVKGEEKYKFFQNAKIVCIPSRYETGCLVALEALAYGKVIVAFDIPVLKETTQNQAVYAKAFDTNDYAQKILYAYQNAAKIASKIKIKPLPTWEEIAKKQEEFYFACRRQIQIGGADFSQKNQP